MKTKMKRLSSLLLTLCLTLSLCLGSAYAANRMFSDSAGHWAEDIIQELDKLSGILLALPLLIAALVKEGGMGGGDIKLTAAAGFVLGLPAGTVGLILGLTAVLGYDLFCKGIQKLKKTEAPAAEGRVLPLAPFLSAGFIAAHIMNLGGLIL